MDVLDTGVVHPAAAPGFRVQGAFKDRPENGGADDRPVKVPAGLFQQEGFQFLGKGRNFNVFVAEQAAVDVGERRQRRVVICQILVPLLWLLIQGSEQLH